MTLGAWGGIIVESKDDTDSRGSCGGGEGMRSGSETDLSSLADGDRS